jgi:hypothetical protein
MLAICGGLTEDGARGIMGSIFAAMEPDPSQATKDEVDLLGDILSSTVDLGHGSKASVAQILSDATGTYSGGLEALERAGVAKVGSVSGPTDYVIKTHLFIACKTTLRFLLKGTQWEEQAIDQILRRLPEAKKSQRMIGGHRPWGVELPLSYLRKYLGNSEVDLLGGF